MSDAASLTAAGFHPVEVGDCKPAGVPPVVVVVVVVVAALTGGAGAAFSFFSSFLLDSSEEEEEADLDPWTLSLSAWSETCLAFCAASSAMLRIGRVMVAPAAGVVAGLEVVEEEDGVFVVVDDDDNDDVAGFGCSALGAMRGIGSAGFG